MIIAACWKIQKKKILCVITLVIISQDSIGSASNPPPPQWQGNEMLKSILLSLMFLPVITSSGTLFSLSFHFPNSPTVLVKAHSSANITKYCSHQLACTYRWVEKATSYRRRPAHTLPQEPFPWKKKLKWRVLQLGVKLQWILKAGNLSHAIALKAVRLFSIPVSHTGKTADWVEKRCEYCRWRREW